MKKLLSLIALSCATLTFGEEIKPEPMKNMYEALIKTADLEKSVVVLKAHIDELYATEQVDKILELQHELTLQKNELKKNLNFLSCRKYFDLIGAIGFIPAIYATLISPILISESFDTLSARGKWASDSFKNNKLSSYEVESIMNHLEYTKKDLQMAGISAAAFLASTTLLVIGCKYNAQQKRLDAIKTLLAYIEEKNTALRLDIVFSALNN